MKITQARKPYARKEKCLNCAYFCNTPSVMEEQIPGLQVMGSGWASVRADDGLCSKRDVYLAGYYTCEHFKAAKGGKAA